MKTKAYIDSIEQVIESMMTKLYNEKQGAYVDGIIDYNVFQHLIKDVIEQMSNKKIDFGVYQEKFGYRITLSNKLKINGTVYE